MDAVVIAIAGPWLLSPAARAALLDAGCPVMDLSSPPALDPDLRAALGHRYTSVDDLAREAGPTGAAAARLERRYERALDSAVTGFSHWVRARSSVPVIQALSELAEERRAGEVERLLRRVDLDEHERDLVVQMSHRLVAGLLHAPLARLWDDAAGELEGPARTLFGV